MRNTASSVTGSGTGDFFGDWFYVGNMSKATIMAVASDGATTGAVKLQVSNEASGSGPQMPYTPTVYVEMASPSAGVSGTTAVVTSVSDLAYQWARLVFRWSAGTTGTVTALFAAHD